MVNELKMLARFQFGVLAFISMVVAGATFFSGGLAKHLWGEMTDGAAALPEMSLIAIQYGYLFPLTCCFASIICLVISIKRPDNLVLLWRLFTFIVAVELIGQAFITLLYIYPAIKITFRMM